MALSLGDISIGAEGLYLGDILIGADNVKQALPPEILFIEWIVIGAGGGGGFRGTNTDYYRGGSGGGGGVVTGSATLQPGSSLETRVGKGGIGATTSNESTTNGNDSSLEIGETIYTALGGGGGGTGNDNTPGSGEAFGKDGGSGGGGASLISSTNTLIFAATGGDETQFALNGGFGMDGCQGSTNTTTNNSLGGAGGTSVGFENPGCPFQYTPGYNFFFVAQFSIGGDPLSTSQQSLSFGGFGGNCNSDGSNGEILIRYAGDSPKASGGSIFYSGGYVYHGFVYSGTDPQYVSAFEYNP